MVDKHRLWYHATGGPAPRFQHHISLAFCGWNMLPDTPEVHVIEDTFLDRRFASFLIWCNRRMQRICVSLCWCRPSSLELCSKLLIAFLKRAAVYFMSPALACIYWLAVPAD